MASSTLEYASTDAAPIRRSAAALLWRRLSKNVMSLVAFGVIAAVALASVAAPVIMPYDPDAPDAEHALETPSRRHWLGTDLYGRDQLTRIVYAGRVDLLVALAATAIALSLGAVLGAVSGYRSGWLDQLLMRVIDTIQAFPSFILAMGIAAALGNSVTNIVIAIAITHVPIYGRLIRGEMLRIRETEYAEAARTVGNRRRRIIFYHLLPNCFPPVEVDPSAHHPRGRAEQAQVGERGHRLAGARLADEPDHLAAPDLQARPVHRLHHALVGVEVHREVPDREQIGHTPFIRGSSTSRSASPSRLNESTVAMIARPGKTKIHHSPETM